MTLEATSLVLVVIHIGIGSLKRVKDMRRNKRHTRVAKKYGQYREIWLETYDRKEACEWEVKMTAVMHTHIGNVRTGINRYASNFTFGGEGASGCLPTEETKKKMALAHKGVKLSNETRKRMSVARKGHEPYRAKLTNDQVIAIFNDSRSQKVIAEEYGVCSETVCNIKLGKNWSSLTGKKYEAQIEQLKPERVLAIFNDTRDRKIVAEEYGVSKSNISSIKNGVRWKDVTGKVQVDKATRLNKDQVLAIFNDTREIVVIAEEYEVSYSTIRDIKVGKYWQKVTGKVYVKPTKEETSERLRKANSGENNPNYGKLNSDETRRKLSESLKGRPAPSGAFKKGHVPQNKKYDIDVDLVKEMRASGLTAAEIALKLGSSERAIYHCWNKGVEMPIPKPDLTPEQVLAIFNDIRSGVEIAKEYGVTSTSISRIKLGKSHSEITGKQYVKPESGVALTKEQVLAAFNDPRSNYDIAKEYKISQER